jgi:hypothetical protein
MEIDACDVKPKLAKAQNFTQNRKSWQMHQTLWKKRWQEQGAGLQSPPRQIHNRPFSEGLKSCTPVSSDQRCNGTVRRSFRFVQTSEALPLPPEAPSYSVPIQLFPILPLVIVSHVHTTNAKYIFYSVAPGANWGTAARKVLPSTFASSVQHPRNLCSLSS